MTTTIVPLIALITPEEETLLESGDWGTTEDRVARGVVFLDRTQPGWRDAVVVNDLDLADPCRCVLGQIFAREALPTEYYTPNGFDIAMDQFGYAHDTDDVAVFFGFDYQVGVDDYPALQAAWESVLA